MGEALRLTIGLDPGSMMACLPVRKIVPSLTELPIFQIALQQKKTPPLFTARGGPPYSRLQDQKISTQAAHTAAEKPLTSSITTGSNIPSNTNVQSFGASFRATVQV
jgi:hypothetical protein